MVHRLLILVASRCRAQALGTQGSLAVVHELNCSAAAAAKSLQSCPTLCDPIDGSPPGYMESSRARDPTLVPSIVRQFINHWTTRWKP